MANEPWTFGDVPGWSSRGLRISEGLAPGVRFGPYEIRSQIGEGATSWVYAARELDTGRLVALKVLKDRLSEYRRERFRREGELAARLNHPGILRVYGGGELAGRPFLVYELVEQAQELGAWLRTRALPERVGAIRDAAQAVGAAHAAGIVHRDLKLPNVLVGAGDRVRVADFGLGRAEDSERLTRTGAVMGTPLTMAPEQLMAEPTGPAADVWGLGVMLYQALTGSLPFAADTWVELLHRVCHEPPPRPSRLDPEVSFALECVCLKALRKDPAERYPDAGALADDLDLALAGRSPQVALARRRARRRPILAAAVAALLLPLLLWRAGPETAALAPPPPATGPPASPAELAGDDVALDPLGERWRQVQALRPARRRLEAAYALLDDPDCAPLSSQVHAYLREHLRERPLWTVEVDEQLSSCAFTGGRQVAVWGDGRLWQGALPLQGVPAGQVPGLRWLCLEADSRRLLAATTRGLAWLDALDEPISDWELARTVRLVRREQGGVVVLREGQPTILVDPQERRVVTRLGEGDVYAAFSPDGLRLATTTVEDELAPDEFVPSTRLHVWAIPLGARLSSRRFTVGLASPVYAPSGWLLFAGRDALHVLHPTTLETRWAPERARERQAHPIRALACAPDGSVISASSPSEDRPGLLEWWDLSTGASDVVAELSGAPRELIVSPDGELVAVVQADRVDVWPLWALRPAAPQPLPPPPPDPKGVVEDAVIVRHSLPEALAPGERVEVEVEVRNTGESTWTPGEEGYKLGAVGDHDPFFEDTRVYLPPEAAVAPGETHTFRFTLTAPADEGDYTTDWRMVHEGVTWFGETALREVSVRPR